MARKSYPKCPKCGKWTVGGANYCHHCGHYLKQNPNQFQNSTSGPGPIVPATARPPRGDSRVMLVEAGIISALAVGNVVALGQEYYTVAIGLSIPLVVYVVPKLSPVLVDLKAVWVTPSADVGNQVDPKPRPSVLQVEFIDDQGRPRVLNDFPIEIELSHLVHIAQRIERGKPFSRRSMVKSGKLSQPQFEQIQAVMLEKRWAYKSKPSQVNSPVKLRDSGIAVLQAAKKQNSLVVGGGGWLAGAKNQAQIMAGRAGEGASW